MTTTKQPQSVTKLNRIIRYMVDNKGNAKTIGTLELVRADLTATHDRIHDQGAALLRQRDKLILANKRYRSAISGLQRITGQFNSGMGDRSVEWMYTAVRSLRRRLAKK